MSDTILSVLRAMEDRLAALEDKVGDNPAETPFNGKITIKYITKLVGINYPDYQYHFWYSHHSNLTVYQIDSMCMANHRWQTEDFNRLWIMAYNSIVGYDNALPLDYFDKE